MFGPFKDNLPSAGGLTLDHVGHFVEDPHAAANALTAAGFTVTPWTVQMAPGTDGGPPQPTGTGNICVMLRHGYVEVLGHTADTPIGLEFKDALLERAGLHLLAFATSDAEALHRHFEYVRVPMRPLARFGRPVKMADGTSTDARFSVARLAKGTMEEGRIQFVTHHTEAAVWQERDLTHPNGALGLRSVLIAAPDPAERARYFGDLLEIRAEWINGIPSIRLERGLIEFHPTHEAKNLTGMAIADAGPAIVGYRLRFSDRPQAAQMMSDAGLFVRERQSGLTVTAPPELGPACWILEDDTA